MNIQQGVISKQINPKFHPYVENGQGVRSRCKSHVVYVWNKSKTANVRLHGIAFEESLFNIRERLNEVWKGGGGGMEEFVSIEDTSTGGWSFVLDNSKRIMKVRETSIHAWTLHQCGVTIQIDGHVSSDNNDSIEVETYNNDQENKRSGEDSQEGTSKAGINGGKDQENTASTSGNGMEV